jgi:cytochrome P450/ferredoxin-NADP reductase
MDMGITNKEGAERRQMRAQYGALFRPAVIEKLRTSIRDIVDDLLDQVQEPTEFELMKIFWEIPARTYCDLVSVPYEMSDTVIRIADSILGTLLKVNKDRKDEAEAAIMESVEIVRKHLNARRGRLGDDFTSVMIRQQEEGLITEEQLVAQSFALLQASVDNTAHQMGNTFGMLLTHPERWQQYVENRDLREAIVEEAIRLHPRFGTIFRLADEDVTIDGLVIPKGTWTFVSVRAGQRDPEAFEDPDEYRLDRKPKRPLMFGAGPYNCLGQNLARMEIEEALDAIAERFPEIKLTGTWERKQANAVSETDSLIVDLGPQHAGRLHDRAAKNASEASTQEAAELEAAHEAHLPAGEYVIDAQIATMRREATDVVSLQLRAADGRELPAWEPGSHIDLVLPNDEMRQYSLCGPREDRDSYRIAVLREENGSGGSTYIHDHLGLSQPVQIRGPRSNFKLERAQKYRFVAGGIGITAILPMVLEAHRNGADWSLLYLGHTLDRLAFCDELAKLPQERISVVETSTQGRPPLSQVTGDYLEGAHLYACGPESLLKALAKSSWPEQAVRFERFSPDEEALNAPKEAFDVVLKASGKTVHVSEDESILEVVEAEGIDWQFSCREGTCGSCEARILSGQADHRDAILSPEERRANETMMICVSRSKSETLELDI